MPVCKLIFRVDYPPCFEVLDRAGALMRVISEVGGDMIADLKEAQPQRMVWGETTEPTIYRQIQVTPTNLNFTVESSDGMDLRKLEADPSVDRLFRVAHAILTQFKISKLSRVGIRFWYLGRLGKTFSKKQFGSRIDSSIVGSVSEHLGRPEDFGLAFEGLRDDKIRYSVRLGPYQHNEGRKYFAAVAEEISRREGDNFIVDLDQSEEDFALHVSPVKWVGPLLKVADTWVGDLSKLLAGEEENVVHA